MALPAPLAPPVHVSVWMICCCTGSRWGSSFVVVTITKLWLERQDFLIYFWLDRLSWVRELGGSISSTKVSI